MSRSMDDQTQLFRELSAAASGQEPDILNNLTPRAAAAGFDANAMPMYGSSSDDLLWGSESGEQIFGLKGDDFLFGNGGNDYLDGDTGHDEMDGGRGTDWLVVDSAYDIAKDTGNDGSIDEIFTTASMTVAENSGIEVVNVLGSSDAMIMLSGSNSNGQFGLETLVGHSGIDLVDGQGGNDSIYGDRGSDILHGGNGDDWLLGGYDNDFLSGQSGVDTLTGDVGMDTFSFDLTDVSYGIDRIADFNAYDDTISLRVGASAQHVLAAHQFHIGTKAHDADDRVIYNATTGKLFYDADGNGSGFMTAFAILQNKPANLSAADFVVAGF